MLSNFHLFTFRGIPIRVHGSLIVVLVVLGIAWNVGAGLGGFLLTLMMLGLSFGFVLLHEFGHAVVALHHGIPVRDITLYPLGGVAALTRLPRDPRTEFQIAIAGPLVNFVLAGLFMLLRWFYPLALLDPLVHVNLALGLFNLLPAFPLDGGRIFRAFLATRMTHVEATRIAARTGQAVAIGLGFIGLFSLHLMLMLIAGFVFLAAQAELMTVRAQSPPISPFGTASLGRSRGESSFFGERPKRDRRAGSGSAGETSRSASRTDQDRLVIEVLSDGSIRRYVRR